MVQGIGKNLERAFKGLLIMVGIGALSIACWLLYGLYLLLR